MTSGQKSLSQWTKCKRSHLILLKKNMSYGMDVVLVSWQWLIQHVAPYFLKSSNVCGCGVGAVVPKMQVQSSLYLSRVALKRCEHTELMLFSPSSAVKFSMKTKVFGAANLLLWLLLKFFTTWEPLKNPWTMPWELVTSSMSMTTQNMWRRSLVKNFCCKRKVKAAVI